MAKKKSKVIEFEIKVIYKNEVYLRVVDASKALGYKTAKAFSEDYADIIQAIKGCGKCVKESAYNKLLLNDSEALRKQKHIEISKVQSLRSEVKKEQDLSGMKMMFGGNILKRVAQIKGFNSAEEYLMKEDIPNSLNKILEEFGEFRQINKRYLEELEDINSRRWVDVDILKANNLDIRYMTIIEPDGKLSLESYICGKGVFYRFYSDGYGFQWNDLYVNDNGELILPYWSTGTKNEEIVYEVNLSDISVDRDFRQYNIIENLIWAIENLELVEGTDYEHSVLQYDNKNGVELDISNNMIVKFLTGKSTVEFVDGTLDFCTKQFITPNSKRMKFIDINTVEIA